MKAEGRTEPPRISLIHPSSLILQPFGGQSCGRRATRSSSRIGCCICCSRRWKTSSPTSRSQLPFQPYPYQLKGIAFLMPRHAALLADEMGLGKTAQVIIALRLLFHGGLIRRALVVCPKPLVVNWTRELQHLGGGRALRGHRRRHGRRARPSGSRLELPAQARQLRTADARRRGVRRRRPDVHFDVVVLDEAQRIKNRESKTAQVVRSLSPRPQLGHDRHADREPRRRSGQHLRLCRSGAHPAGHAGRSCCRS